MFAARAYVARAFAKSCAVMSWGRMSSDIAPVTIKKYANRRLYNTGTSAYVTLEDLASMVKNGQDFLVYDAKSGEDITRSVLTQIIFEQEGKSGQSLMPVAFLRQLIRFYGDSVQAMVPSYLEFSLDKLTKEKGAFSDQCVAAFGPGNPLASAARPVFGQLEEQTKQNMAMFRQALSMFAPFVAPPTPAAPPEPPSAPVQQSREEFDDVKRQLEELQRRIEGIAQRG
jgi:polyhydroxyalkanoate synthesis repressor PhaR